MGKRKDLSEFDKGQIVMARRLDHSISKTAALVGCSWSLVVSIYQKWSKEGTVVNRRQGHGWPRLTDACGERRLACVIRSNRRATVAQIAKEVNAGSDRKVSECTVHDGSELFWQQKGDQHNIRQVIMLCLIAVMKPTVFLLLSLGGALSLKICSFNIRSFGESKISKPDVLNVILESINRCDIMLVMEIKDAKGQAFPRLMAHLNRKYSGQKHKYGYVISQRLGRKSYKEQYAFVYRQKLVSVKSVYQYPDMQPEDIDAFAREPYVVWFSSPTTEVKEFVVIPIHTPPEAAVKEIDELYDVYQNVSQHWQSQNFIIMGDFNAACGYVPKKEWRNIRLRSDSSFVWLTDDKLDTSVKESTKCAYDRVVLHGKAMIQAVKAESVEVYDFKQAFGLTEQEWQEFQSFQESRSPEVIGRRGNIKNTIPGIESAPDDR
ncbi:hypothetical protein QTP86_013755 [Hemibagrus guttatus]|nr:hypothetical protein QTP86_013755 [Hemibagrus guttatus]